MVCANYPGNGFFKKKHVPLSIALIKPALYTYTIAAYKIYVEYSHNRYVTKMSIDDIITVTGNSAFTWASNATFTNSLTMISH